MSKFREVVSSYLNSFQSVNQNRLKPVIKLLALVVVTLLSIVLSLGVYLMMPPASLAKGVSFSKSQDYDEAKTRFQALQVKDSSEIRPECKSVLLDHGKKTTKSIVLFHGFTTCPAQFDKLGSELFNLGYNVLIPRLPYHGYNDLITKDQSKLTSTDILDFTKEVVGLSFGLGEKVEVLGLSGGAVMSLWAGLNLPDIDKSIVISPIIQPLYFRDYPQRVITQGLRLMPDIYRFWDMEKKELAEFAPYAYKGFSSKALSEFMTIGYNLDLQAREGQKSNTSFYFVTSEVDNAVDNNLPLNIAARMQDNDLYVKYVKFDAAQNIPHDCIDPRNKEGNIAIVYPVLLKILED